MYGFGLLFCWYVLVSFCFCVASFGRHFFSLLALPALFVRWLPLWDAVRLFGGHGFGYRYAGTKRKNDTTITVDEARDILGLRDVSPLTEEVINKAYKNLMRKVHPDHGGSSGLAARLNTAREVLLRRYS